jgi:hypothetical protein
MRVSALADTALLSRIHCANRPSPIDHRPVKRFAILVLFFAAACRSDPVFKDMSDSTFVRTMVALRRLPVSPADPARRAQQRDSLLKVFGVTGAQLESTAVRLATDPVRAAEIWRAIESPRTTPP